MCERFVRAAASWLPANYVLFSSGTSRAAVWNTTRSPWALTDIVSANRLVLEAASLLV
jgi:hypothetical protein